MPTLALNIRMQGKLAVVVGGGSVAGRKLRTMLRAGARVRVVAEKICPDILNMTCSGGFTVRHGSYSVADLDGAFLVIAATDSSEINRQIAEDAGNKGIMTVVVDDPAAGDCTFPALMRRGDLEIAVSTGGRCPTFAVDVRDLIEEQIGNEYAAILEQLAEEREKLLTNGSPSTYNTQVLHLLARRLLAELTERKDSLP